MMLQWTVVLLQRELLLSRRGITQFLILIDFKDGEMQSASPHAVFRFSLLNGQLFYGSSLGGILCASTR